MGQQFKQWTDNELAVQLRSDNEEVFSFIFHQFYKELCRYALQMIRIEESAEEVVQETFVKIWEKRKELHITTSFKAYLYTAVRNRSINYLKSKFAQTKQTDIDSVVHPHHSDVETTLEGKELQEILNQAISLLPEKCRIIFNLSRQTGLSYAEIAEQLNISIKTVENQMGIALKKLREYLHKYWEVLMVLCVCLWM
jgi:RNA polymerase sigma-70 factor, ECF subfamily